MIRLIITSISMFLLLVACETPAGTRAVTSEILSAESDDAETVVFGRVIVKSSKAPAAWTETDCTTDLYWQCPDSFRLAILKAGDPKPILHRLTGDGSFAFLLEPGEYFLAEWQWCENCVNIQNHSSGRLGATFTIEEDDTASYLGDLLLEIRGVRYAFDVSDNFETAMAALANRQPDVADGARKNILEIQKAPDGASVISVCSPTWGGRCDDNISGVEPIDPPQADGDFPEVSGLSPTLTWHAVKGEDVTYDVIVYEAIPYGPPLAKRYVQGRVVEYARGISGTSHKLEIVLKPDSTYFWTIRLRRGDVVSEWSSASYWKFGFFIVAAISESAGRVPYQFRTP
jgi:hypothetical protein